MVDIPFAEASPTEWSLSPGAGFVLAMTLSLTMWWAIARLIGVA